MSNHAPGLLEAECHYGIRDAEQLIQAVHSGDLSSSEGTAMLCRALQETQATSALSTCGEDRDSKRFDVLDYLGAEWHREADALRVSVANAGMRVPVPHAHMHEVISSEAAATIAWIGVIGTLEMQHVLRAHVEDSEYTACGHVACPLLHTPGAPQYAAVFKGLMPKPECGGSFPKFYPPYHSTWGVDTLESPRPPPIALPTSKGKLVTMQALLVQLCSSAVRDAVDTLTHSSGHQELHHLLRCLWALLHSGGAYYLSEQDVVQYGTTNARGTHSGGWLDKELRQANLVAEHGFPRNKVTYTDMVMVSVFHISSTARSRYRKVGTGNEDKGDVNWAQIDAWLNFHGSHLSRNMLCERLSRAGEGASCTPFSHSFTPPPLPLPFQVHVWTPC